MDLLSGMNKLVEYIEEHLDSEIDYVKMASLADCSVYQYTRMFGYIAGVPLSEYIRRRRLTKAAAELTSSNIKVIDLAVKYGYDSPTAFTRAFSAQHGVSPTSARTLGTPLKAYPKISFQMTIKGESEMNYRIEEKEAFEVFGIERIFNTDETGKVPDFWTECHQNGEYERLFQAAGGVKATKGPCVVNAVCGYGEPGENIFPYMLCAFVKDGVKTDGFKVAQIPKATWAVFRSEESDDVGLEISNLFSRAYSEWLPSSGYDKAVGPDIEMYCIADSGKNYDEVWIPVVKK